MVDILPMKSRFNELYPMHPCPQCQLEHVRIPHIVKDGDSLVPHEVLVVVEGTARWGGGTVLDTPVRVMGVFWGFPGANQASFYDIIYLN